MAGSYVPERSWKTELLPGLIFYPGAKAEASAYAPLLYELAEDGVLNMDSMESGRDLVPEDYTEICIEGGNHAQFGTYDDTEYKYEIDMYTGEIAASYIESH